VGDGHDLVGSQDIADRLGWSNAEYVHAVAQRDPSFPEPFKVLGRSRIWSWSDVREWAVKTGRRPVSEG
jgi:predicted DNA-binding transcriptional regulator AlpA